MAVWVKYDGDGHNVGNIDENPITHKAIAKLHAKLDRIERKLDFVIGRPLIEWDIGPAFMNHNDEESH